MPTTTIVEINENEDEGDGTEEDATDESVETTTEAISSTQRTEQVEQPGFFQESTATTENLQKSKGM